VNRPDGLRYARMPDQPEAPKPPRISTLPLLVITIAGFAASVASCNYLNVAFDTPLPALAVAIGWNIGTILGFGGLLSLTFTGWRGFGAPPRPGGSPTPNQALILSGSGVLLALSGCGYFAAALERSPPVSIAGAVLFFGGLLLAGGGLVVAVLRARRK